MTAMMQTNRTRRRAAGGIVLLGVVAAGVILLAGVLGRCSAETQGSRVKTNEDRVEYLQELGWEVNPEPLSEQTVLLPEEFPQVLAEYNDLQLRQGFDLTLYAGKEATVYLYQVLNYPSEDTVCCCLYVWKNRVIGGDIHSTSFTGFMTGLR